jgi:hypothetical protein
MHLCDICLLGEYSLDIITSTNAKHMQYRIYSLTFHIIMSTRIPQVQPAHAAQSTKARQSIQSVQAARQAESSQPSQPKSTQRKGLAGIKAAAGHISSSGSSGSSGSSASRSALLVPAKIKSSGAVSAYAPGFAPRVVSDGSSSGGSSAGAGASAGGAGVGGSSISPPKDTEYTIVLDGPQFVSRSEHLQYCAHRYCRACLPTVVTTTVGETVFVNALGASVPGVRVERTGPWVETPGKDTVHRSAVFVAQVLQRRRVSPEEYGAMTKSQRSTWRIPVAMQLRFCNPWCYLKAVYASVPFRELAGALLPRDLRKPEDSHLGPVHTEGVVVAVSSEKLIQGLLDWSFKHDDVVWPRVWFWICAKDASWRLSLGGPDARKRSWADAKIHQIDRELANLVELKRRRLLASGATPPDGVIVGGDGSVAGQDGGATVTVGGDGVVVQMTPFGTVPVALSGRAEVGTSAYSAPLWADAQDDDDFE